MAPDRTDPVPLENLQFRAAGPETWPDLARLFEARGAPKYCWCTLWLPGAGRAADGSAGKRAILRRLANEGIQIGLIAYLDGDPAGWCAVAPRDNYRALGGDVYPPGTCIWSVVCFFVPRPLRGRGLMTRLLRAACDAATAGGADVIEGYPVDADSPSYKFMGLVGTFAGAGFEEFGRIGLRRHAMRRWLRPPIAGS